MASINGVHSADNYALIVGFVKGTSASFGECGVKHVAGDDEGIDVTVVGAVEVRTRKPEEAGNLTATYAGRTDAF